LSYSYGSASDKEYVFLDSNWQIIDVLREEEGFSSSFIYAPDKSVWVILLSLNTNNSRESVLPLINGDRIEEEILKLEFVGCHKEVYNDETFFFWHDLFASLDKARPDKLCRYIFDKNNLFKDKKQYKLPTNDQAKMHIEDGFLYLVDNKYSNIILHTKCDFKGNVLARREIMTNYKTAWVFPIRSSFTDISTFFIVLDKSMYELDVDKNGVVIAERHLYEDDTVSEYYNIWRPVIINNQTYVVKYNHENGTGYAVMQDNRMKEYWANIKSSDVYKDIISGEEIKMLHSRFVIWGVTPISNNQCVLAFTPMNDHYTLPQTKPVNIIKLQIKSFRAA